VSKIVKLLTLVAVVAMIVVPSVLMAQADKEAVYVPKKGDEVKTWTVKKTFEFDGMEKTFTFTLKRIITGDPEMKPYIYPKAEEGDHSTWTEGISVTGPTDPVDMGYFTVRATGKFYKATPPPTVKEEVKKPTPTGWKRGMTVVRSK